VAEHFYYPHVPGALPHYRQNLVAAISRTAKVIVTREGVEHYDLDADADEREPQAGSLAAFDAACRVDHVSPPTIKTVIDHLDGWQTSSGAQTA